jgi:hypothetical protein
MHTTVRVHDDHIAVYDFHLVTSLVMPAILLFGALVSSIRAFEGPFCLGQLFLVGSSLKYFFFFSFFFFLNLVILAATGLKTTQPAMGEVVVVVL